MNKRMREPFYSLLWKASIGYNDSWSQVDPEVLEKFAELIAKECLEQIYSVTLDNPTDDWDQGYDSGLHQAAETIKEHFGVE